MTNKVVHQSSRSGGSQWQRRLRELGDDSRSSPSTSDRFLTPSVQTKTSFDPLNASFNCFDRIGSFDQLGHSSLVGIKARLKRTLARLTLRSVSANRVGIGTISGVHGGRRRVPSRYFITTLPARLALERFQNRRQVQPIATCFNHFNHNLFAELSAMRYTNPSLRRTQNNAMHDSHGGQSSLHNNSTPVAT